MPVTVKGGSKLDKALAQISKGVSQKGTLQVGYLENARYPDGTLIAMVAAIQNFGAPRASIPPRPFFSNMIARNSAGWPAAISKNLKDTNYDVATTLARMGEGIKGQLQDEIVATFDPPLSPITVMLRGMRANDPSLVVTGKTVGIAAARVAAGKTNYGAPTKPLVDSGLLLNKADYRVVSG
jgi:hypothetical protein